MFLLILAVYILCCFGCLGKNASFLRVVRCRSLAEEYSVDSVNKDEIGQSEIHFLVQIEYFMKSDHLTFGHFTEHEALVW